MKNRIGQNNKSYLKYIYCKTTQYQCVKKIFNGVTLVFIHGNRKHLLFGQIVIFCTIKCPKLQYFYLEIFLLG